MSKRGNKHLTVQKQGKVRDLYTCQICGSNIKPEGHHIIDYQFGGAADSRNITTLCHICHKKVHRGEIDLILF